MPKDDLRKRRILHSCKSAQVGLRGTNVITEPLERRQLLTATWTQLTNDAPGGGGTMELLSNGSVLMSLGGTNQWGLLTPSSTGSYINGTWSQISNMHNTRLYDATQTLENGNLFVAGGEYGNGNAVAEVYNPLTDTWTVVPSDGNNFVDADSAILSNGNVLIAPVYPATGGYTYIYNPTANTMTQGAQLQSGYDADEQNWVKLTDGSILAPDGAYTSQRYIPSSNTWVNDAVSPVQLNDNSLGEFGTGALLPNGNVFYVGGEGGTAIYTPSGNSSPGSWTAGPTVPGGLSEDDAPMAVLSDGTVLFAAGPNDSYNGPTALDIYNPTTNSITSAPNAPTENGAPYGDRFLDLPDGTVLACFGNTLYDFNPGTTPLTAPKPTITSIVHDSDGSYLLTGTQLNGNSEGAYYGDDAQMSSNYPIVRLTSGAGTVYFARTYNWSSTGVDTGTTPVTSNFTLPLGLPAGTYTLNVMVNGFISANYSFSNPAAADTAPTVATAASATPTPATGTTSALSVLGAASAGESTLTYTWTTTSYPTGGTPASFSANGTNSAKNTIATFQQAGSYTFKVYITDSNGLSTSSSVTMTVQQTLTSIIGTPTPVNLTAGQSQQLSATGYDQFGNVMNTQPAFTWAVASGGGTVSATGNYTAPATGTLANVTATSGSVQAMITIGVVKSPWTSADIGGPTLPGIAYDSAATTTVEGSGDDIWASADEFHLDYQTLTGNVGIIAEINAIPTVNTDGSNSFAAKAGVMFRDSTATGASFVDLVYTNGIGLQLLYRDGTGTVAAQQGNTLSVSGPLYVQLARVGTTYTGSYSYNGTTWTPVGSYTMTSSATNNLVGLVACSHDNTKVAKVTYSNVSFTYAQTLTSISLTPTPVNLTAGQTQQLTAIALDQLGNPMNPQPTITWAVTSGAGTVNASGLYTAPATGTLATVTATTGSFQALATLTVVKSPWTSTDIGGPTIPGIAYDSFTTTTVDGSGDDIWLNADEFHFDYQTITGSSSIVAEINTIPTVNTDASNSFAAKAGVMFRDSIASTASFVDLVYTNGIGLQLLYRNGTGTAAAQQGNSISVSGPLYVKLLRSGTTYTGSYSTNGTAWTLVGSYTDPAVGSSALTGLVACSHSNTELATVVYSNVAINQPSLVTAAVATPSPVTGTTASLSVLGANIPNPSGEASLSYTWVATSVPADAIAPTFSTNGMNAAKTVTATFYKAGSYTFTVTIADSEGDSVTSTVAVTVNQTLTSLSIPTVNATVVGASATQVTATDQFGNMFTQAITWSVNGGGSVSSSGVFTANQSGGTYTITAVSGGSSKNLGVTVVPTIYTDATGSDAYAIRLSAFNASLEQIFINTPETSAPTYTIAINQLSMLTFNPTGGDGNVTVDFANGNPLPSSGIGYVGGSNPTTGGNRLFIKGINTGNLGFSINATQIVFAGNPSSPIAYSNLQGIEFDLLGGSNSLNQVAQPPAPVTFNAGPGNNRLNVSAGAFTFSSDPVTLSGNLTVNDNASVIFASGAPNSGLNARHLAGLNLGAKATAVIQNAGAHSDRTVLVSGGLSLASNSQLDLGDNDMIVQGGVLSTINGEVATGYNSGKWNGSGISSSISASDTTYLSTLGVIQNSNGSGPLYPTFDNQSSTVSDVLVKYTYTGDAGLNGQVDSSDYARIDNGYLNHLAEWTNGDFNYDGVVNGSDYTLIDNAFNTQGASLAASIASPQAKLAPPAKEAKINRTNQTAFGNAPGNASTWSTGTGERTVTSSFLPGISSNAGSMISTNSFGGGGTDVTNQRKDVLDALNFGQ